jgi:hypothetical protein
MSKIIKRITLILIRMSKCQKNKYAAGGKCGSMSNSAGGKCGAMSNSAGANGDLSALIASREKQDALLLSNTTITEKKAIVPHKTATKSDIDTVLDGDF